MTPEELDELERLLGEATPGPWGIAAPGTAESPFVLAYGDGDSLASFEPCGPWVSPEQAFADLSVTAALRNAAPALLLAARENAALRAENRSLVQTLCDEVNKAKEELRARLEAAEKVVEAARGYIHAVMDNGNPASSPGATLRTLDTALSAYDRTAK